MTDSRARNFSELFPSHAGALQNLGEALCLPLIRCSLVEQNALGDTSLETTVTFLRGFQSNSQQKRGHGLFYQEYQALANTSM